MSSFSVDLNENVYHKFQDVHIYFILIWLSATLRPLVSFDLATQSDVVGTARDWQTNAP